MFAAARTGDEENPERASSATQFYIVTGKFFTEMELDKMEKEQGITFTPEQRHEDSQQINNKEWKQKKH